MNVIYLTLPVPPLVNRYWRNVNGIMKLSAEARTYKLLVAAHCQQMGITSPFEGDVQIEACVFRPREAGDCDSYIKSTLDSLQGFVYVNDKQVRSLTFTKTKDAQRPRIEIIVKEYQNDLTHWQQLFNAGKTAESNSPLHPDDAQTPQRRTPRQSRR